VATPLLPYQRPDHNYNVSARWPSAGLGGQNIQFPPLLRALYRPIAQTNEVAYPDLKTSLSGYAGQLRQIVWPPGAGRRLGRTAASSGAL